MDALTLTLFLVSLVLLPAGAEILVRGASTLAAAAGVSQLAIGLTVVAYGTSSPELAVSTEAALAGDADIALGNVVGSNIINILFILGACALIAPLVVERQLVWREVPVMIAVALVLLLMALDGRVSRVDGLVLVSGALIYTVVTLRQSRRRRPAPRSLEGSADSARSRRRTPSLVLSAVLIVAGLGMLIIGAGWLIDGAVEIARAIGVDELVIGLTVVAAGTSMPEMATSVVAALRGQRDMAVGNVIGSCIFNVLFILGVASVVAPDGVDVAPAVLRLDLPVMIAVSAACLPLFFTGHEIPRWEGALFVSYYAAYVAYLLLDAAGHAALPAFSSLMLLFVVPVTAVTIALVTIRELRRPARGVGD